MSRTATTRQVAAALHVKPATVRKYARSNRLPFDTTPGGHRRFDVEEAVRALAEDGARDRDEDGEWELVEPVPFVRIAPTAVLAASTSVTEVTATTVRVHDTAREIEDWATETSVV